MGLFDKFKKNKEEEIVDEYEEQIDSKRIEFDRICDDIEDNFQPETVHKEDHLQAQLYQWISARYDYLIVERETSFGRGNRTDLLLNGRYAFEIKLVDTRTKLRDLVGQLKEYSDSFDYVCAILFFTEKNLYEESQDYVDEYQRDFGIRSIAVSGKKRGYKSRERPTIARNDSPRIRPQSSQRYEREEPKKPSKLKRFLKGVDDFGKAVDQVSKALEPPPERKRKRRSSSDDSGFDYSKFIGSDEQEKPKRKRKKSTTKKKTTKRKTRKKEDDDSGMDFFGKPSKNDNAFGMDFFGTEPKKKKRKKKDEDDWTFGF